MVVADVARGEFRCLCTVWFVTDAHVKRYSTQALCGTTKTVVPQLHSMRGQRERYRNRWLTLQRVDTIVVQRACA